MKLTVLGIAKSNELNYLIPMSERLAGGGTQMHSFLRSLERYIKPKRNTMHLRVRQVLIF